MRIGTHFIAATLATILTITGQQSLAQPISVAASAPGSGQHSVASALAKVLTENGKMNIRLQAFGGEGVFIPLLNDGTVDLSAITSPVTLEPLLGSGAFKDKPQPNLRAVGVIAPIRVGVFVRKTSDIKTMTDIRGRRIVYDLPAHPTLARVLDGVLANAGLTISDLVRVSVPNVVRGIDELISGNVDIAFFGLTGGKLQEADAALGGVRFLSLINTADAEAAMQKLVPTSYLEEVRPAPGLVGIQEPTNVMTYDYLIIVNSNLPDDLVYKITKTAWENEKALQEASPSTREFAQSKMFKELSPIEYHPGALRFFKEVGATKSK